jgi:hypothetical protein
MNKYRISGLFTVEENSFKILGDLLQQILTETMIEKDLECAKFCMIISQTFYRVSQDPLKPRIFLQEAIEGHEIWKQTEFWEGIIKYSINEDVHNQRAMHTYFSESFEEKQMRIQSVAFGQLLSFSFNMLSFQIPKEKVKETINTFCKIYKINDDMLIQLLRSVDDYTDSVDQQIKMDIIEDNMSQINNDDLNDKNEFYVQFFL